MSEVEQMLKKTNKELIKPVKRKINALINRHQDKQILLDKQLYRPNLGKDRLENAHVLCVLKDILNHVNGIEEMIDKSIYTHRNIRTFQLLQEVQHFNEIARELNIPGLPTHDVYVTTPQNLVAFLTSVENILNIHVLPEYQLLKTQGSKTSFLEKLRNKVMLMFKPLCELDGGRYFLLSEAVRMLNKIRKEIREIQQHQ